jgi:hypothetical protein
MWSVNDALIKAISTGDGRKFVVDIDVSSDEPYLDIDLIGELTLAHSGDTAQLIDDTVKRIKRLRAPQTSGKGSSDLLINCGGFTVDSPARKEDVWVPLFQALEPDKRRFLSIPGHIDVEPDAGEGRPYYRDFFRASLQNEPEQNPEAVPVATIVSVNMPDTRRVPRPMAYVVVIGFDSNDAYYRDEKVGDQGQVAVAQLEQARALVDALTHTLSSDAPLYVIAVTHHSLLPVEDHLVEAASDGSPQTFRQGSLNAFGLLHHCANIRASVIVNTHMHAREVHSLSTMPVEPGRTIDDITIVACPSFGAVSGRRPSGLAHLRLNVWRGEAEIGYVYDDPDGPVEPRLTQVTRPLVSASRVSAAEQRLHIAVKRLLADERERADEELSSQIGRFDEYVDQVWQRDGYVPLTFADGTIPRMRVTRFVRYNLLLLLRRRPGSGSEYELLTSHHTPLQPPRLGDWNSVLLPAFTSARNLLEHLRDDVVRQVADQAGDLRKARDAKQLQEAVENVFAAHTEPDRDVWEDSLREVDMVRKLKISPTTGQLTEYEYRLVTILPLIEKDDSEEDRDAAQIRKWLSLLPAIRPDLSMANPTNCVPIEATEAGGAGLRWEPTVELKRPQARDPRAAFKIPPGAIWYPAPSSDEVTGPWTRSPAIVSRNADVMHWVDEALARKRNDDGSFPDTLILEGATAAEKRDLTIDKVHTFEETCEALRNVTYDAKSDLHGRKAYAGKLIQPVLLVRRGHGLRNRDAIVVVARDSGEELGVLRPVQRYVRLPGIQRAEDIYQRLERLGKEDPDYDGWGYVEARKGAAATPVSITPPIVEQLSPMDAESDDDAQREFLLCDGNHRVINSVWRQGRELAAVAIIGEPNEPYYARPFGTYEWQCTSDTEVTQAVDNKFKYNARVVDDEFVDSLPEERKKKVVAMGRTLRYRRYYRDLGSGFGDVGGQGGAY